MSYLISQEIRRGGKLFTCKNAKGEVASEPKDKLSGAAETQIREDEARTFEGLCRFKS